MKKGTSYTQTNWLFYKESICYNFNKQRYGSLEFYVAYGYEILKWSDFMIQKFTKKDLKNGDVIKRRNGDVEIAIVDLGVFVRADGYHGKLCEMNEDLTARSGNANWDIIAVRRPIVEYECSFSAFDEVIWKDKSWGELIYERQEPVEMTFAEVCAALGKEIKIIKG